MKVKVKTVNLWYMPVSLSNRKSCPQCKAKLQGRQIYGWYEYHAVRMYLIDYFCELCYIDVVLDNRVIHQQIKQGVQHSHNVKYGAVPEWITAQYDTAVALHNTIAAQVQGGQYARS